MNENDEFMDPNWSRNAGDTTNTLFEEDNTEALPVETVRLTKFEDDWLQNELPSSTLTHERESTQTDELLDAATPSRDKKMLNGNTFWDFFLSQIPQCVPKARNKVLELDDCFVGENFHPIANRIQNW